MNLFCIHCGRPIAPDQVDPSAGTAHCTACNETFSFAHRSGPSLEESNGQTAEGILPRPPQMRVDHWGSRLVIRWRWFTPSYLALAVFCVAWDSFLIFWYSMAIKGHTPWIAIVFPIAHVAAGVAMTYAVLCGFFNSTTMEISPDELIVRHGPFPTWGNRQLSSAQIRQPFCQRSTQNQNNTSVTYQLSAMLDDGRTIKLVTGLRDLADAKFLERQIELAMNIKPQSVVGEA